MQCLFFPLVLAFIICKCTVNIFNSSSSGKLCVMAGKIQGSLEAVALLQIAKVLNSTLCFAFRFLF